MSFLWRRLREAHDLNLRVTGWVLTDEECREVFHAYRIDPRDNYDEATRKIGLPIRRVIDTRG